MDNKIIEAIKGILRRVIAVAITMVLLLLTGCANVSDYDEAKEERFLSAGEAFDPYCYIDVDGVKIRYDGGNQFTITNNTTGVVRVTCTVVGVKKDGSYDMLQIPAFYGVDETLYENELAENGWAVETPTNMIRPADSLAATLFIFDWGEESGYPAPDIDGDGYYDIIFTIHPQKDEHSIVSSTDDPESEIYKLKVE